MKELRKTLSWLTDQEFNDLISYAECEGIEPLKYLAMRIYD